MTLSEEFKKTALEMINDFLQQTKQNSYQLIVQDKGFLSNNPQDFNFGYGLGYLEGVISTNFLVQNDRQMELEENLELRTLIAKIAPEYKELIFKGGI